MSDSPEISHLPPDAESFLSGKTVRIVGKLQSTFKKDVYEMIRQHGGRFVTSPEKSVDWLILGKREGHFDAFAVKEEDTSWLTERVREDLEEGKTRIATETQLLQRLFPSREGEQELTTLYTPTMLAKQLGVKAEVIRNWYRKGLIVPVRVIRRLPYFALEEVFSAQKIHALLADGAKLQSVEQVLGLLRNINPRMLPHLTESDFVVRGSRVLLRRDEELLEPNGQLVMDFSEEKLEDEEPSGDLFEGTVLDEAFPKLFETSGLSASGGQSVSLVQLREAASAFDEMGRLSEAEEMYRNLLFATGASASDCFQLGDLLYRQGNLAGARERFSMAIELDEDYVEARVALARVLVEEGDDLLATQALWGAIAYHPEYREAYHLLIEILERRGLWVQADEVRKRSRLLEEKG
ncbi:MAG: MerR family transcriptional regulator [Planctomycetia bacterium]|nr:MerR family transcriptional regulator [Planctomycetia bacterium]